MNKKEIESLKKFVENSEIVLKENKTLIFKMKEKNENSKTSHQKNSIF